MTEKQRKRAHEYIQELLNGPKSSEDRLIDKKEYNKKWAEKNKDKVKIYHTRLRNNLRNGYIREKLLKKGFKKEYIDSFPSLIEIQREIIKIKRLCRSTTSKN